MKIVKYGTVTITEGPIKVEGWQVEPEESDPKDATGEEMLLEVVLPWAQETLRHAVNAAVQQAYKKRKKNEPALDA